MSTPSIPGSPSFPNGAGRPVGVGASQSRPHSPSSPVRSPRSARSPSPALGLDPHSRTQLSTPSPTKPPRGAAPTSTSTSRGPWGQRTPQCTPRRKPATRSAVTPSPTRMSRATSNTSTANGQNGHLDEWHVPSPQVMIGAEDRMKMGRGRLSKREEDAETTLSSLYVSDEMANYHQRRGWGAALIGSAVSATVFGAAVGLTAYRIWTGGWGSIVQEGEDEEEPIRPEPPQNLPPPSLEDDYDYDFEDDQTEPLPPPPFPHSPASPRTHRYAASTSSSQSPLRRGSARRRRRRTKRPTIAELLLLTSPTSSTSHRPRSPDTDMTSTSSVTGLTGLTSPSRTSRALKPITGSDGSDRDSSGDETNARLAAMASRVQALIAEGQSALSTPISTPPRERQRCPRSPSADRLPLDVSEIAADFPTPPHRDPPAHDPPSPIDILNTLPRPREHVSGWDTDTTNTNTETETEAMDARHGRARRTSNASSSKMRYSLPPLGSLGHGRTPTGPSSRPVSVSGSLPSTSGSLPRSSSVSSTSSRYQPAVPPLPWRRESAGATSRWVQKQHSPNGSMSSLSRPSPTPSRNEPPPPAPLEQLYDRPTSTASPSRPAPYNRPDSVASTSRADASSISGPGRLPSPQKRDGGSRIPRPGAHSRASSVTSGGGRDSPSPHIRLDTPSRLRGHSITSNISEHGGWNSPAPPQGLVASRTSLFASVAERNSPKHINRSKIPIRRSMGSIGSISSITAVQTPSPKA